MIYLFYFLVVVSTFALMELITWATHKYVMHGFLWVLHKDHHVPHDKLLEHNDWFAVIFAVPSILLFYLGHHFANGWLTSVALGILLYGIAYFIVHDIIIHQRIKLFTHSKSQYVRAIRWAHSRHHTKDGPGKGESFGFLWVEKKYRDKIKQDDALAESGF